MDRLQLYLAGVGVGDRLAAPHHAAEQGAVLPHQVRAAAGVSAQAVAGVRRGPGSEGVAGVEVAVGQEAAGAAGAVIAPVVAGLLYLAQLLAQLAVAGPLVAGRLISRMTSAGSGWHSATERRAHWARARGTRGSRHSRGTIVTRRSVLGRCQECQVVLSISDGKSQCYLSLTYDDDSVLRDFLQYNIQSSTFHRH